MSPRNRLASGNDDGSPKGSESEIAGGDGLEHSIELSKELIELQAEVGQLLELAQIERAFALDVTEVLKPLLLELGRKFELNPLEFPKLSRSVTELSLMPDGVLIVSYGNGLTLVRALEDLSPDSLVKVLKQMLPETLREFTKRRKNISVRSGVIEKLAIGLNRVGLNSETA